MRRAFLLASIAAGLSLPQIGLAADLPLKAPPKAPPPVVTDWTGFYFGGHVGGGWDVQDHTRVVANANFPAGFVIHDTTSGGLGGIQGGFNYQFAPQWVLGLEGDYSWAHLTVTDTVTSPCPAAAGCINPGIAAGRFTTSDRLEDRLSDVTGRLGLVFGEALLYGKGGVAWARTGGGQSSTFNANGTLRTTSVNSVEVLPGWLIGGGVEWKPAWAMVMSGNLTFKVEYNFVRLNTNNGSCSTEIGGPNATIGLTTCGDNSSNNNIHVVKGGVNFLFNPWSRTVASRY